MAIVHKQRLVHREWPKVFQLLPKLAKENVEITEITEQKEKPMVFSQIQRIYKYQTHYSCRVGLSWSNQKIKPKNKTLEEILTGKERKLM